MFLNIIYNFLSSVITKIYIYIGHRFSLRIKKTLKNQSVFQWIYICNTKDIRNQTPCSTSPARSYGNRLFTTVIHKIPDYDKICIITFLMNYFQLIIKSCHKFLPVVRITPFQTFFTEKTEIGIYSIFRRYFIFGKMKFIKGKMNITILYNTE
ncbi:MAG: hypothetical protein BWY64_01141 [bacterium ADurb.Bin363]|nr:MAG: hypothetical protein BWY64_01141 [bacterium ADurb.Bin363]